MASHELATLSKGATAQLQLAMLCVVLETLAVTIIQLVPRVAAGWPAKRVLVVSFLRSLTWIPFASSRKTKLTTGQAVEAYCKTNRLTWVAERVSCTSLTPPAILHFIPLNTSRTKEKILFYLHGGAYVNPIDIKGQLPFAMDCSKAAGVSELVILEYTLAPGLQYPGQLVQAVEALNHLLQTYDASQVVLGGDSAGGNLLLALIAHIKQPNPRVKPLPPINANFHSVYLISPWVALTYESKSFRSFSSTDYIRKTGMTNFTEMWKPTPNEIWADFLIGGAQFWHDIPVTNLLIVAGGWESFLDDVLKMAKQLGASTGNEGSFRELFVGVKEVHVQCALDKAVGLPYGHSASKILNWLKATAGRDLSMK